MSTLLQTWDVTCNTCVIVRNAIVSFFIGLYAFGESIGRARAASQLYRHGYHDEAKRLMLDSNI